ncbi:uncharacterized protein LOC116349897 [Contarinia nasturtii]|uniref:uncharacterized protein LOC116349897 n=1 Tax=Contarinia nasturtii TaxID=265458 RepID=UPI0012D4BB5E|nr:uncharacterized protein LOC116349897 [Contarinia nasturtii]
MRSIHIVSLALIFHMYVADVLQEPTQRCPRMCICNLYMGLNMANCSGEHLISANIEMSSSVEFLDLTNNDITTIENNCFKDLRHLESVLLNHNSISFIELDAFSQLTKLKNVDLSHNRLESFDSRIFEQNLYFTKVDLSGNKFMHLPNAPILRSASLEILDLHNSQLTHLHVNYFGELPNIRYMDLSENLLIVLNLAAFAINNRLRDVNLKRNRMKCDEQTEMSIIWMERNHVSVSIENCPKQDIKDVPPLKFERMQMLPMSNNVTNDSIIPEKTTPPPVNLNSVWKIRNHSNHNLPILNEKCNTNETTVVHACRLFEICVSNLTMLIEEVEVKLHHADEHMKENGASVKLNPAWYDFVTVQVAFYGGLFTGTIFGTIMLFTLKLISDCVMVSDTDNGSRRRTRNRQTNHTSECDEMTPCHNSTAERRTISNRRSDTSRETIQSNDQRSRQSSTSFFAIFYERPVRHRYYRQINRSATNLVRRLSQSRLFLNSSRTQNGTLRGVHTQRNRQEATHINRENSEPQNTAHRISVSVHSLNILHDNSQREIENRTNAIRICSSESDVFGSTERSETPPPPYNIVAHT